MENCIAISDTAFIMANQPNKQTTTITEKLDLIEMGFAWEKDIKKEHKFQDLVNDMKFKI